MVERLRWGIIGTGGIAGDFARALAPSSRCHVENVVGSTAEKGRAFAERSGLPRSSGSLTELLSDAAVDAVYVATPHPLHETQALACIEAGKHVLCEKPFTMDAASSERVIAAARARGVFVMEAFMYRCHPLLREVLSRLEAGAIGAIRHVRADFGFRVPRNRRSRLFDLALGGGSILDVGGYPVSFARLIAGLVAGKRFDDPTRLRASGHVGPTGADEFATATLEFASGMSAQVTSAIRHDVGTAAVIFGEEGRLVVPDPWIPGGDRHGLTSEFSILRDGERSEVVRIETQQVTYAIEAELVADTLPGLEPAWPAMSLDDTLGNMRVLDAWQAAVKSG